MPSIALRRWQTEGTSQLDEIAAAHPAVGGSGRGRRYATREINHAYAVLLTPQFQRFCRDLHTEAVAHIVAHVAPPAVQSVLRTRLLEGRKLDQGNPNPSNLGSDFGRLDAVETEMPVDELTLVALPNDPAEKRIGVEAVGDAWIGTYTAPDGRVAVVTEELRTPEQATRAARRWVRVGLSEKTARPSVRAPETPYVWRPDPRHPGRFAVFRQGRLGDEIVLEQ